MRTAEVCNDSIAVMNRMDAINVGNEEYFFTDISDTVMICTVLDCSANKDKLAEAINVGLYDLYNMDRIESQWDVIRYEFNERTGTAVVFIQDMRTMQPK